MRIVYLDIDTLRPDHLGCYGYLRNTSPNLDRIAAKGVLFDQCFTTDAPCLPSRSALMTGTFGIHNGVINHDGFNADFRSEGQSRKFTNRLSCDTLPAFLKHEAKLHTVYIGGFGERHSTFGYYAGFREIHDTGKGGMESAEEVTPTVLKWLADHGKEDNWYLHINYWDPHTPYRAPAEFGNPFAGEPLPAWLTEDVVKRQLAETVGPHGIWDIAMYDDAESPQFPRQPGKVQDMAGVRREIDGYDCGIRYADTHVGMLMAAMDKLGILEDTAFIISSDHGENMGELGLWSEHATADYGTSRIPMIISWPGMQQNLADRKLHYNIDLLPTLAELLGKAPRDSWEGQSFAATIRDGAPAGRDELILSQCCHGCQRSVRWGDYLYIRTYHDFFHLFPKEMLFNVAIDPHEEHDLAAKHPEICAEATRRYLAWHDDMMFTQPEGYWHDPLWEVIHRGGPCHAHNQLAKYCDRLKKTGRQWAVEPLKSRHPEEFQ